MPIALNCNSLSPSSCKATRWWHGLGARISRQAEAAGQGPTTDADAPSLGPLAQASIIDWSKRLVNSALFHIWEPEDPIAENLHVREVDNRKHDTIRHASCTKCERRDTYTYVAISMLFLFVHMYMVGFVSNPSLGSLMCQYLGRVICYLV